MLLFRLGFLLSLMSPWGFHSSALYADDEFTVLYAAGDYPPYEMVADDGSLAGFHFDVVNEVSRRAGLKPRYIPMPWRRAVASIRNGMGDSLMYAVASPEREEFLWFLPENQLGLNINAYSVRADHPLAHQSITAIAQLKPYSLGIIQGYIYPEEIQKSNFFRLDNSAKDDKSLLRLLLHGRMDVALLNTEVTHYLSTQMGSEGEVHYLQPYQPPMPHYIAFSKYLNKGPLAQRFAKAYRKFKMTEAYSSLAKKYQLTPILPAD